jgi:hypothetical protein
MILCETRTCGKKAAFGIDNTEIGYTYACADHRDRRATPIDRTWVHSPSEGLFPIVELTEQDHERADADKRAEQAAVHEPTYGNCPECGVYGPGVEICILSHEICIDCL